MSTAYQFGFADLLGLAGFGLYVANYLALSLRWFSGDSLWYFAINLTASSLVLIGLTSNFNLASALIQIFWVVLSICAIGLRIFRPVRPEPMIARLR